MIPGMMAGDVIVEGGTVELRGMVSGNVHNNGGNLQTAPTAMVRGQIIQRSAPT